MKDQFGHGSNKSGMASAATAGNHQQGVLRVGKPFKVQQLALDTSIGAPWRTVKSFSNKTVAEKVAMGMRVRGTEPNPYVRIR